jgi:hypothetical protein
MRIAHPDGVVCNEAGEARTAVLGGHCVFLVGARCSIHDEPYYPSVCRGFPWREGNSAAPYGGDLSICPELKLPQPVWQKTG